VAGKMSIAKSQGKDRSQCNYSIIQLLVKRQGRPLLVGDHLEAEIKLFLEDVCKDGSVVDTHILQWE